MPPTGTIPPPASPPVSNPPPVTPVSPLTAGQPLTDLVRLANTSATPNVFAAHARRRNVRARRCCRARRRSSGRTTRLVPGPLIEVFEGDTVRIRLENRLSQETTVHWHGLPVPPDQDGSPMDPIAPGASRTYEFTLPRRQRRDLLVSPAPA